ncbi:MAG: hypothetical protein HY840_07495 [Bacteroidetes bacterium]|nr:hypothetical protein [Bacteroidota bacterium]
MKKTSTALFELIHSLTMAEKKYFKMFSSFKGGDKSYLRLYDAIEKQGSYNEEAIHATCRGQNFLRHISVAKRRLHANILRSLENYHTSADINLRSQLNKSEILLRKGLSDQALKLLKTAKPLSYQHEKWGLLIELLDMERILYVAELRDMSHLNQEKKAVLEKLSNVHEYQTIHHEITRMVYKAGPLRTKKELLLVSKLMRHPLLRNSKQALCAEAKTYYYEIWSQYYRFKRDAIKGYHTSKEHCEFIKTHFHQLKDPGKRHLFALNSIVIFIGYLLPFKRSLYGEMQEVLKKLRSYPPITNALVTFWVASYVNELNALMQIGDFEKVIPVIKAIEENQDLLSQMPSSLRNSIYYNIAYMNFGADRYNEALRWLQIIDWSAGIFRQDVQASARLLSLLTHYELHKDEQLLNSLKRSTLHFLSTRHRLFKVEEALMHCLHQIMGKAISKKERSTAFQEFKTTLLKLRKNPIEKIAMEDFDFLSWVESKIQNKTFAEIVRKKVKRIAKKNNYTN